MYRDPRRRYRHCLFFFRLGGAGQVGPTGLASREITCNSGRLLWCRVLYIVGHDFDAKWVCLGAHRQTQLNFQMCFPFLVVHCESPSSHGSFYLARLVFQMRAWQRAAAIGLRLSVLSFRGHEVTENEPPKIAKPISCMLLGPNCLQEQIT